MAADPHTYSLPTRATRPASVVGFFLNFFEFLLDHLSILRRPPRIDIAHLFSDINIDYSSMYLVIDLCGTTRHLSLKGRLHASLFSVSTARLRVGFVPATVCNVLNTAAVSMTLSDLQGYDDSNLCGIIVFSTCITSLINRSCVWRRQGRGALVGPQHRRLWSPRTRGVL
jgi:hypothetical protein